MVADEMKGTINLSNSGMNEQHAERNFHHISRSKSSVQNSEKNPCSCVWHIPALFKAAGVD